MIYILHKAIFFDEINKQFQFLREVFHFDFMWNFIVVFFENLVDVIAQMNHFHLQMLFLL